jgi:hypothetical protein
LRAQKKENRLVHWTTNDSKPEQAGRGCLSKEISFRFSRLSGTVKLIADKLRRTSTLTTRDRQQIP